MKTFETITKNIEEMSADAAKAEAGNKSAAVRARVKASEAAKLLKQLRVELLPLTK